MIRQVEDALSAAGLQVLFRSYMQAGAVVVQVACREPEAELELARLGWEIHAYHHLQDEGMGWPHVTLIVRPPRPETRGPVFDLDAVEIALLAKVLTEAIGGTAMDAAWQALDGRPEVEDLAIQLLGLRYLQPLWRFADQRREIAVSADGDIALDLAGDAGPRLFFDGAARLMARGDRAGAYLLQEAMR